MASFLGLSASLVPLLIGAAQLDPDDPNTLRTRDVPWGPVSLAIFLMLLGMTCLVLAWLHVTQEILGKEQAVSSCRASRRVPAQHGHRCKRANP